MAWLPLVLLATAFSDTCGYWSSYDEFSCQMCRWTQFTVDREEHLCLTDTNYCADNDCHVEVISSPARWDCTLVTKHYHTLASLKTAGTNIDRRRKVSWTLFSHLGPGCLKSWDILKPTWQNCSCEMLLRILTKKFTAWSWWFWNS